MIWDRNTFESRRWCHLLISASPDQDYCFLGAHASTAYGSTQRRICWSLKHPTLGLKLSIAFWCRSLTCSSPASCLKASYREVLVQEWHTKAVGSCLLKFRSSLAESKWSLLKYFELRVAHALVCHCWHHHVVEFSSCEPPRFMGTDYVDNRWLSQWLELLRQSDRV